MNVLQLEDGEVHCVSLKDVASIFESVVEGVGNKDYEWLQVLLWDDEALQEFQDHEEFQYSTHTKMQLGRMLYKHVDGKGSNHFGLLEQMNWKEDFILVDLVSPEFGSCGIQKCLRVRETFTLENASSETPVKPRFWDVLIFPECLKIAEEMIRHHAEGVKTTVAIWNSYFVDRYPKPWMDNGDMVLGEIFLKPTNEVGKVLTVLFFHHEKVSSSLASLVREQCRDNEEEGEMPKFFNLKEGQKGGHMSVVSAKKFVPESGTHYRQPETVIGEVEKMAEIRTSVDTEESDSESGEDSIGQRLQAPVPSAQDSGESDNDQYWTPRSSQSIRDDGKDEESDVNSPDTDSEHNDDEDMGEFVPATDNESDWGSTTSKDMLEEHDKEIRRIAEKLWANVPASPWVRKK